MSLVDEILAAVDDVQDTIPSWALVAVVGLTRVVVNIIQAKSEDGREEALMQAAEVTKAALDKKKFGR